MFGVSIFDSMVPRSFLSRPKDARRLLSSSSTGPTGWQGVNCFSRLATTHEISFLLVLPISLSGLGVREGEYVYLFAQAGVSAPLALAMSLLFHALNGATGLIDGVLCAFERARGYVEDRR